MMPSTTFFARPGSGARAHSDETAQRKARSDGRLTEALALLSPDERKKVVDGIIPAVLTELKKTPAPAAPGQPPPVDTSFPFKDAAFAMLTYDKAILIADDQSRKAVTDALIDWSVHDFDRRLDNTAQMFGMEQSCARSGPAVKGSRRSSPSTRRSSIGSPAWCPSWVPATKEAASTKLVELAKYTTSQTWVDKTKPAVEEATAPPRSARRQRNSPPKSPNTRTKRWSRCFASIKKVGTRPAVDLLPGFRGGQKPKRKRRQAAVAALEGRLDRNNAGTSKRSCSRRGGRHARQRARSRFPAVGEMPREQVIGKLFGLFGAKRWKCDGPRQGGSAHVDDHPVGRVHKPPSVRAGPRFRHDRAAFVRAGHRPDEAEGQQVAARRGPSLLERR